MHSVLQRASESGANVEKDSWGVRLEVVGKRIRELRMRRGMMQKTVADRSGTAAGYFCRVESGRFIPTLEKLAHIADALGVPMTLLLASDEEWAESMKASPSALPACERPWNELTPDERSAIHGYLERKFGRSHRART